MRETAKSEGRGSCCGRQTRLSTAAGFVNEVLASRVGLESAPVSLRRFSKTRRLGTLSDVLPADRIGVAAKHIDPCGLRRYVILKVGILDQLRRFKGRPQILEESCCSRGVAF